MTEVDTGSVTVVASALPSGAATEATLAGALTTTDFDSKVGALTETAPATDTASSGLNGRAQRIAQRLTSLIALLPGSLGQKASAASLAVVVASDQSAVPVSSATLATETTLAGVLTTTDFDTKVGGLTETAPATDTASSGLNGRAQRIAQRLTSLIALFPTSLGQKASAASFAVVIASDQSAVPATVSGVATDATLAGVLTTTDFDTKTGSLTETAPATDTASSGLNGRLQRIAQRLTSLIALFPTSLGQKTMANSFAVAIASDQSAVPISGTVTASGTAGDVATGSADSGNPVKGGLVAHTALPTALSDGQRGSLRGDKFQRLLTTQSLAENNSDTSTTITNSTSETTIVAADASNKQHLHILMLSNSGGTPCEVAIRDSTAGTIRLNVYVPAGETRGFAVNESGSVKQTTANNNWTAQCSAGTTSLKVFAKVIKATS
ncbi:MAG: hypothetical protein EPO06_12100 [Burkholderiaceae bacterium]|nr:MAG: hypothetical protein EPO06_12100 [Burkholderiaceae bacterium]